MRPTKDGQFDITSPPFFLMNSIWQQRVVGLIREFYPQKIVQGHPYHVHTVLHALMTCVTKSGYVVLGNGTVHFGVRDVIVWGGPSGIVP